MNNIYLYDPAFDEIGHFKRFQEHYKYLFSAGSNFNVIILENILVKNIQRKLNKSHGIWKVWLWLKLFVNYTHVLYKFRRERLIFLSQGPPVFWVVVILFVKNYVVCMISCQHFLGGSLKNFFKKYLDKSKWVVFTNSYHRDLYYKDGIVIHDRLFNVSNRRSSKVGSQVQIKVLGHINRERNPLNLLQVIRGYSINIMGLVDDDLLADLNRFDNVSIRNSYLSDAQYREEISTGLIYIPVSDSYSSKMISGVLLDVIEAGGIPLIDSHPIYSGLVENNLCLTIEKLSTLKPDQRIDIELLSTFNKESESGASLIMKKWKN